MCGIVGYIGTKDASGVLLDGLKRLEYRGYDSAGIAIIGASKNIEVRRSVGKLFNLEKKVHSEPDNGNIENYLPLKEALKKQGAVFKSETDTEILAHLISRRMKTGKTFEDSVRETLKEVKGSFAIAVMSKEDPDKIIGARMECPLVVGIGDGEGFIASDIPAILNRTKRVIFLEDGEIVTLTKDNVQVKTVNGKEVKKTPREIDWSPVMAEKGGYRHFMLKEIFEQSRADRK